MDHKNVLKNNTKSRLENIIGNSTKMENVSTSNSTSGVEGDEILELDRDELADKLTLGSQSFDDPIDKDLITDFVLKRVLRDAVSPERAGDTIVELLHRRKKFIQNYGGGNILRKLLESYEKKPPKLSHWIRRIKTQLPFEDLSDIYRSLFDIKMVSEILYQIEDPKADGRKDASHIHQYVESLLKEIDQMAHPDSKDIGAVLAFHDKLPPLVKDLLKQDYGLISIGPNEPTKRVRGLLKQGDLNDLRLLGILSPMTDFILNSVPYPDYTTVRTWMRDSSRPSGNDLMPIQRFSEISRALFLEPGKSLEENLIKGGVFLRTSRRKALFQVGLMMMILIV